MFQKHLPCRPRQEGLPPKMYDVHQIRDRIGSVFRDSVHCWQYRHCSNIPTCWWQLWMQRNNNWSNSRTPQCTCPTMHNSKLKYAHFCSKWCIVGYGAGALWHLRDRSIRTSYTGRDQMTAIFADGIFIWIFLNENYCIKYPNFIEICSYGSRIQLTICHINGNSAVCSTSFSG